MKYTRKHTGKNTSSTKITQYSKPNEYKLLKDPPKSSMERTHRQLLSRNTSVLIEDKSSNHLSKLRTLE